VRKFFDPFKIDLDFIFSGPFNRTISRFDCISPKILFSESNFSKQKKKFSTNPNFSLFTAKKTLSNTTWSKKCVYASKKKLACLQDKISSNKGDQVNFFCFSCNCFFGHSVSPQKFSHSTLTPTYLRNRPKNAFPLIDKGGYYSEAARVQFSARTNVNSSHKSNFWPSLTSALMLVGNRREKETIWSR
jgi:hypothetical protein